MPLQLTTREAEAIFAKLELEPRGGGSHHVMGVLKVNGRTVLTLFYSHGRKSLPGNVPQKFRRDMHLSVAQFLAFKVCTLSRAEYLDVLREGGWL